VVEAYFGIGGFAHSAIGLHLVIQLPDRLIPVSYAHWDKHKTGITPTNQTKAYAETLQKISNLLHSAGVYDINDLCGKTVQVTLDNNKITNLEIYNA
jgi:hypothetical protein